MKSASLSNTVSFPVVVRSTIFSKHDCVINGVSTRQGGVSPAPFGMNLSFNVGDESENVAQNRERFFGGLGVPPGKVAFPQQRHTDIVRTVSSGGVYENCDALVTNARGVYLSVTIADCAPVFLFDSEKVVVACVHAGWRGTQRGIVWKAVEVMRREFGSDPGDILAYIGPSAGVCCYEVGQEVADQFHEDNVEIRNGTMYLNIKQANRGQLFDSGIPHENLEILDDCTICNADRYHSYRRDREQSGRMMAVIGISSREKDK